MIYKYNMYKQYIPDEKLISYLTETPRTVTELSKLIDLSCRQIKIRFEKLKCENKVNYCFLRFQNRPVIAFYKQHDFKEGEMFLTCRK